uniref:Uncharacterized protein n=1 Tax=Arundo donax TaxID=35708 RepID=A0A0A9DFR6_ARUDO
MIIRRCFGCIILFLFIADVFCFCILVNIGGGHLLNGNSELICLASKLGRASFSGLFSHCLRALFLRDCDFEKLQFYPSQIMSLCFPSLLY